MRFSLFAVCTTTIALAACTGPQARQKTAEKIAHTAHMTRQDIAAPPFTLASWQKWDAPGNPVHIYIEGDGLAWTGRKTASNNPTPKYPLALELAAHDPAPNVVYIARPCQYTEKKCSDDYWMGKRFAPEVLSSFQTALDTLAIKGGDFHLIGYSGGANIAGLLAEQRGDILSLRTVAGNIDNDFFTAYHKVSPMPASLNMADFAPKLAQIPQTHYIGKEDKIIPPAIFESYTNKIGSTACVTSAIMPDTTHQEGWTERWESLLKQKPSCLQ